MTLPRIHFLATGGTIAGHAASRANTVSYQPAAVGIETLLQAVPELHDLAQISGEQFAQVASADVDGPLWIRLARRVNQLLAETGPQAVDGVVVTHGTDTLEETAYFLDLAVASTKPVVLVGAMRPSTALGSDGPANIFHAVAVAADARAWGRGTLVVMHQQVHTARGVTKASTHALDAFRSAAPLGVVHGQRVAWQHPPAGFAADDALARLSAPFLPAATPPATLPWVEIITCHAGHSRLQIDAARTAGVAGIVVAGVGDGCLSKTTEAALGEARASGIHVVRTTRIVGTPGGPVSRNGQVDDDRLGFLVARDLSPQKARILLMLALLQSNDLAILQQFFDY